MNLPPSDHIVWKLARQGFVGLLLLATLYFYYKGLDQRDAMTVITVLLGLLGFDAAKQKITSLPQKNEEASDQ